MVQLHQRIDGSHRNSSCATIQLAPRYKICVWEILLRLAQTLSGQMGVSEYDMCRTPRMDAPTHHICTVPEASIRRFTHAHAHRATMLRLSRSFVTRPHRCLQEVFSSKCLIRSPSLRLSIRIARYVCDGIYTWWMPHFGFCLPAFPQALCWISGYVFRVTKESASPGRIGNPRKTRFKCSSITTATTSIKCTPPTPRRRHLGTGGYVRRRPPAANIRTCCTMLLSGNCGRGGGAGFYHGRTRQAASFVSQSMKESYMSPA